MEFMIDIYQKRYVSTPDQNKETLQIIERWQNGESDLYDAP